jgi:hypothetical protein
MYARNKVQDLIRKICFDGLYLAMSFKNYNLKLFTYFRANLISTLTCLEVNYFTHFVCSCCCVCDKSQARETSICSERCKFIMLDGRLDNMKKERENVSERKETGRINNSLRASFVFSLSV